MLDFVRSIQLNSYHLNIHEISFVRAVKISNLYLKIRDNTYNDNRKFNTIKPININKNTFFFISYWYDLLS